MTWADELEEYFVIDHVGLPTLQLKITRKYYACTIKIGDKEHLDIDIKG